MKKIIYKSTLFAAFGLVVLSANAQNKAAKDTTLNRQVMLERDYNPSIMDASKINTTPAIYEPIVQKRNAKFIETSPIISLKNNQLGKVESGDINTDILFDKKRGYLLIGAGTNSDFDGAAGYRIVDSERDELNLFGTYNAFSHNIDYVDNAYAYDKAKAKYSDAKVNLNYAHTFDPSILSFDISYRNNGYNYYGNPFVSPVLGGFEYSPDLTSRQVVDVFSIGAGLRSTDSSEGLLKYKMKIGYDYFKNKYGALVQNKGIKGGIINAGADFWTPFDSDKTIGVDISLMSESFSGKENVFVKGYDNYMNIGMSPYFNIEGEAWKASLGVNLNYLSDVKNSFLLAPNVSASYNVNETSTFYGVIGSRVNNNTFLDVLQENRYVNPQARVEFSKTFYDAKLGFRSGALSGFEFDIFGGYKYTQKDHLYLAYSDLPNISWGNVNIPVYANVSTGHFGGQVKTSLIPYTDLSVKVVGYFYSVKYKDSDAENNYTNLPTEKKAWGRPSITAELNADVKPIPQLTLSLNYQYAGGRKTYLQLPSDEISYGSVKMKDVNELGFRAEYQILDWISVNGRLINILNQKYELQPGYALQGFGVMGGFSFKF